MDFRPKSGCSFLAWAVFSAGAPLDFRGGPLDLPWGASGRLGAHFAASGFALLICSSLSLRRALVFSKIFGACGGLWFFQFFSAPAAGSCLFFSAPAAGSCFSFVFGACGGLLFFSICFGACGGLLFSQNLSAPAAGSCFSFVSLSHLMSLPSLSRLGPPAQKNTGARRPPSIISPPANRCLDPTLRY